MSQKSARLLATRTAAAVHAAGSRRMRNTIEKTIKTNNEGACFHGARSPPGTSSIAGSSLERCVNHGNHDNCAFRETEKWVIFDEGHNAASGAKEESTLIHSICL